MKYTQEKIQQDDSLKPIDIRNIPHKKQGHILFASFNYAREIHDDLDSIFDIKLHITLHTNKGIIKDFIHVPQLAPSKELFNITMYKWKKLKFTNEENDAIRNGKTGTWTDLYKPAFIKEMETRKDFKLCYDRIKEHLTSGKNIIAICYCEDKHKCHRQIISDKLLFEGFKSECI